VSVQRNASNAEHEHRRVRDLTEIVGKDLPAANPFAQRKLTEKRSHDE
jgi:hypothetical protein